MAVRSFLREQPKATQKEIAVHIGKSERTVKGDLAGLLTSLAVHIGKSERTVKSITVKLVEKGIIERKSGNRNGFWEIKKMV